MANIIQQLEDLKEWGQDPTRYAARLKFRSIIPSMEAQIVPEEFDELSPREEEYYRKPPFSTRDEYRKGQLVQPGPEGVRQGYARPGGNPEFGQTITGTLRKGTVLAKTQPKLDLLKELIDRENSLYRKNKDIAELLNEAGWKGGWDSVPTSGETRKLIHKYKKKLLTTQQKMDNYVNNVMLAEDAVVQDFRNPKQHLAKKFGVSRSFMDDWSSPKYYNSKVYHDNIELFHGLSKELSFNKYKLLPDGTPRLMSDYSVIQQHKLPSTQGLHRGSSPEKFILESAHRHNKYAKHAGIDSQITFINKNYELLPMNQWQFIKDDKLYSLDPSIDTVEFRGQTYKNNYLNRVDAAKLYKKDFGEVYKMFAEGGPLEQYMNEMVIDPQSGKEIKLDTLLRRNAFEKTGKKGYLLNRFMDIDHADIMKNPFGELRLLDATTNKRAGIIKRLEKYKDNPKLLASKLDEIGYNRKFNDTNELIKFYRDDLIKQRKWKVKPPKAGAALDNLIKKVPQVLKALRKGASVGKTGLTGFLTGIGFGPGGVALEAALEGAVYEYYRRKGYTNKQAEAETFTYRLLKEAAKGKSTKDVPWYGGADELLEKDLYQLKGEEEFIEVDGRPPIQHPEFDKVIGERTAVKRYIDNEKALLEAEEKYDQLYTAYKGATTGPKQKIRDPEKADQLYKALEFQWKKMNSIEDQLDLDRDSYNTAKEKQETEQGKRSIEYGHYGRGDTERLAKKREERRHQEFLDYRQGKQRARLLPKGKLEERVEDPLAETPYTFLKTEETLPAFSLKYDPTVGERGAFSQRFPWEDMPRYQEDEGIKRKWQDIYNAGGWDLMDKIGIAGGVANMAGGGIANVRRPNAIPPVSGPMPQGGGLSTMFNRVKPW